MDHAVDYVLFERQRDLRPASFLRYYLGGKVQRVVLVLHSYELLVLLAAIAWLANVEWLWGWVFGMLLHLPLDIVFNGKFASGGLVHFYSFIVRARAGFRADRFMDRPSLAVPGENFWVSFFRGGRVAGPPPRRTPASPEVPAAGPARG